VDILEKGLLQPDTQWCPSGDSVTVFRPGFFNRLAGGVIHAVIVGVRGEIKNTGWQGRGRDLIEDTFAIGPKAA
jgi:hypothetical protein